MRGGKKESQCDIRATRREPDQWRGTADFFLFFFFFWARWQKKGEEKEREQTNETRAGPSDTNRWREVSAVVLIEGKLRDFVPTCFSAVAHLLPLTHTHTHTQASPQAISCPLHQCPLTGWNVRVTHAEKPSLAKFMCLWVVGHTHRLLYFHVDNKMPVKHIPRLEDSSGFIHESGEIYRPKKKKHPPMFACLGMGTGSDVTVSTEWTKWEKKTVWAVNAAAAEQTKNRTTYRNSTNRKSKGRKKNDAHTWLFSKWGMGSATQHNAQYESDDRLAQICSIYMLQQSVASCLLIHMPRMSSCLAAHGKLIAHKKGKKQRTRLCSCPSSWNSVPLPPLLFLFYSSITAHPAPSLFLPQFLLLTAESSDQLTGDFLDRSCYWSHRSSMFSCWSAPSLFSLIPPLNTRFPENVFFFFSLVKVLCCRIIIHAE